MLAFPKTVTWNFNSWDNELLLWQIYVTWYNGHSATAKTQLYLSAGGKGCKGRSIVRWQWCPNDELMVRSWYIYISAAAIVHHNRTSTYVLFLSFFNTFYLLLSMCLQTFFIFAENTQWLFTVLWDRSHTYYDARSTKSKMGRNSNTK